jgi:hypothetical protein
MRHAFRIIAWSGIALAMGPGSSIPNDYDAICLMGGVLMVSIGAMGMIVTLEKSRASTNRDTK